MKIFTKISSFLFVITLSIFSGTVFAAPALPIPADPLTNGIELVNVNIDEEKGNGDAYQGIFSISSDGRYIAFESNATNLVDGDTNGFSDIFVRDMQGDAIERVSVDFMGMEGNDDSYSPAISADGRYIAFESRATNLVADDTNAVSDIFVYDRDGNTIERVSVDSDEVEANSSSYTPSISADGEYVAFESGASNLVADDTNIMIDIFVRDIDEGVTERVSIDNEGGEASQQSTDPSISSDGRYVVFISSAIEFSEDVTPNAYDDVFMYDRDLNTIQKISGSQIEEVVSGAENGHSFGASISAGGEFVVFDSGASNLVADDTNAVNDIFVYDIQEETLERVNLNDEGEEANARGQESAVSSDGRYVVFASEATNLVADDTNGFADVFAYDRDNDMIIRLTADDEGNQANGNSHHPSISSDGSYVSFWSNASNLVAGDVNDAQYDVFRSLTGLGEEEDTTPPDTFIISSDTESSIATFEFSANEEATFECSLDAAPFTACTSPYVTPALAVGPHSLEVKAIDASMNEDLTPASYEWLVGSDDDDDDDLSPSSSNDTSTRKEREQSRKAWDEHYGTETVTEGSATVDASLLINRLTRRGNTGAHVVQLQTILNTLGYTLTPDGIFGPMTETAVKDFQTKHGLISDGIVGPMTLGELLK